MYDESGVLNKAILNKFEIAFVTKFLNYAIGYKDYNIFIQRLYYVLMKYSNYLFNITYEYEDLFNAAVQINRSVTRTRIFENSDVGDRTLNLQETTNDTSNGTNTNSGTDNVSGTSTGTVDTTNTITNSSDTTSSSSGTNTGTVDTHEAGTSSSHTVGNDSGTNTGTVDTHETDASSNRGRTLNTDYPQSSVNIDMEFPLSGQFDYASTGSDTTGKTDNTKDNLVTNDLSTSNSSDSTVTGTTGGDTKVTNNLKDTNSGENHVSGSENGDTLTTNDLKSTNNRTLDITNTTRNTNEGRRTSTTTDQNNVDRTGNESEDIKYQDDTISPFERTRQLMELVDKYEYSPIYKVLGYVEDLFLSKFVDDDRYMYVTPAFIDSYYKEG